MRITIPRYFTSSTELRYFYRETIYLVRITICCMITRTLFTLAMLAFPAAADPMAPVTAPPIWTTECDFKPRTPFGEKRRQYCFLTLSNLSNPGFLMPDGSWKIGYTTLIEIDAVGIKVIRPKAYGSPCRGAPRKIAVDGRRIDGRSHVAQIEALASGSSFAWESQRPWPHCTIAVDGSLLAGFSDALREMQAKWAARPQ
jgi:hypothetical protein